jgi:hypothetical protein
MPFNQYTASNLSLVKLANGMTEIYYPLWVYSSGTASTTQTAWSNGCLQKGNTVVAAYNSGTAVKLYILNSNWSSSQKFAFEASIYGANTSATYYASLWDATTNTVLPATQISTTATTATLLRSSSFTLTPGHIYGVAIYTSNASYSVYLAKAHLVALLS